MRTTAALVLLLFLSIHLIIFLFLPQAEVADPESTSFSTVGDFAQLEALLAGRMKSLESDLAGLRRDLLEARRQEVRFVLQFFLVLFLFIPDFPIMLRVVLN